MKNLRNYGLRSLAVFRILAVFIFVLSLFLTTQSHAQEETCTTLDDFNFPEAGIGIVLASPVELGPLNLISDGSPGVLGSLRDITYGPLGGFGGILRINTGADGLLGIFNAPISIPPATILYNAGGAGLNVDLSNAEFIRFQTIVVDNYGAPPNFGATITITLIDSANNTASTAFPPPLPVTLEIPITDFSGVDLSEIQAIRLDFEFSGRVDIEIDAIEICGFPGVTSSTCQATIVKSASPADDTLFEFSVDGNDDDFTLSDPSDTTEVINIEEGDALTVTEQLPPGWQLDEVVCDETSAGINPIIIDGGVSFECTDTVGEAACTFSNSRIPTNVPTLSEWGLIAMAGILGIVGFIVMRKREAVA